MTEPTNESVREDRERQTQLLADLRAAGRTTEADQLSVNYHGLQMAGLAQDVYRAAAGGVNANGGRVEPPPGWTRASEHPEQLQALAPGLSREQINDMLRPAGSGFRAEIYLPDPAILGPDARPVFAIKGSTGPIVDPAAPGGMRESGAEDYLANNIPQGLGQRADYYDRAMDAARLLQRQPGLDFEITGHSLGGGIASAAGAVTGVQTTTFNAAGLHPNTPARYVAENGGAVHDLRATITAFQVNGDVLTDSQTGAQRMSEASREAGGALANNIGQLLQTPGIRDRVQGQIDGMLPENARGPAMAAIDLLATQPGAELLRDVPTAAGNVQPLMPARMRNAEGNLVDRPNEMPVSELMTYAGPLVDVLNTAAVGGRVGRVVGEGVQVTGQGVEQVLHYGGTALDYTARFQGETVAQVSGAVGTIGSTAVRTGGEVVVGARVAAGYVGAGIDLAQGEVQHAATSWTASAMRWAARALPEDAERWVGRQAQGVEAYGNAALAHNRDSARQSVDAAHTDAGRIREGANGVAGTIDNNAAAVAATARQAGQQVGATLQEGADVAGRTVRGVTDQAPAAGAVVGTGLGLVSGVAITYGPQNPYSLSNIGQTFTFGQNAMPSGNEALQRHLMETVTPSLEAVVRTQEAQARELLQASRVQDGAAPPSSDAPARPVTPPATPLLDDAAHPNNGMYRDAQRGVNALGAPFDAMPQSQRDQLAGALVADSVEAGLTRIARVDPGAGNGRIFASDNPDPSAAHNRIAGTDVAQGQAQPLAASTQQVDRVHERAAEHAAQHPQPQTQNDPQQDAAPRKVA